MRKLGVEWLSKLSKEDQILFCKNRVNHRNRGEVTKRGLTIAQYLILEYDSFSQFIDHAFMWEDTPEGHDYWDGIGYKDK
jgi:hypothetical protein